MPPYAPQALLDFASALLTRAGLSVERARIVAEVLLEADLLGHTTHGLDMLPRYLQELQDGGMAREGEPVILQDRGCVVTWDGCRLPGPWLVTRAVAVARERAEAHGIGAVVIRRSHHIGCLQAYLEPVAKDGLLVLLTCSDPSGAGVAPCGGTSSVLTPNPIAVGFPTSGDPVLIDVSMSTTTNAMIGRVREEGRELPGPWLIDADGRPSRDPAVLQGERPGATLPLGGMDLGHKGFALALMVEALSSGLAGFGRADAPTEWGASVFLQVIDPAAFGGRDAFVRETSAVAALCHASAVPPGKPPVRLPGERALARRREQLRDGVVLYPTTMPALAVWAERLVVARPAPAPERSSI